MDLFLIEQMHSVFVTDAKLSSHPIVQTVNNPDEITAIFDEISYKKVTLIFFILFFIFFLFFILCFNLLLRDRQSFE